MGGQACGCKQQTAVRGWQGGDAPDWGNPNAAPASGAAGRLVLLVPGCRMHTCMHGCSRLPLRSSLAACSRPKLKQTSKPGLSARLEVDARGQTPISPCRCLTWRRLCSRSGKRGCQDGTAVAAAAPGRLPPRPQHPRLLAVAAAAAVPVLPGCPGPAVGQTG